MNAPSCEHCEVGLSTQFAQHIFSKMKIHCHFGFRSEKEKKRFENSSFAYNSLISNLLRFESKALTAGKESKWREKKTRSYSGTHETVQIC